jgi:hypothetical protein
MKLNMLLIYDKFLQSHLPVNETFRSCLKVYLHKMFQLSTLNWVSLNFKFPGKVKIKQILPATKFVITTSINKAFMRN